MASPAEDAEDVELHKLVWYNREEGLLEALKAGTHDIDGQDKFGNTALIIACMLNHTKCIAYLLDHGATIKIRNHASWSALQEAISYGDRDTMRLIWTTYQKRARAKIAERMPDMFGKLTSVPDFTLTLNWKFASWIPFLGRVLPSDTFTITKRGTDVRMDTTIRDFKSLRWVRGNISLLFLGRLKGKSPAYIIDHDKKVYKQLDREVRPDEEKEAVEDTLDSFAMSPINSVSVPGLVQFQRAKAGIWGFRTDKSEQVGRYEARVFNVKNMNLCSKKRMEHMTKEDLEQLQKHQAIMKDHKQMEATMREEHAKQVKRKEAYEKHEAGEELTAEETQLLQEAYEDTVTLQHRGSLPPPPRTAVSFEEYFGEWTGTGQQYEEQPDAGQLGRPMNIEEKTKTYTASLYMTDEFPLPLDTVLSILRMAAAHNQIIGKLTDFIDQRLPEGFPVKLHMPVFPTVSATVTFLDYEEGDVAPAEVQIPEGYRQDQSIFKGLDKAASDEP